MRSLGHCINYVVQQNVSSGFEKLRNGAYPNLGKMSHSQYHPTLKSSSLRNEIVAGVE